MSQFRGLEALQWLDLSETSVSDTSVPELGLLTSLRRLDLWDTQISEGGIATLQRALPDCAIAP